MYSMLVLIDTVISIYLWVVIAQVVLSWLVSFRVVNTANRFIYLVGDFLYRATEPALNPIRRVMPNLGGIDVSPLVLIIGLIFVRSLMFEYLA